MSVTQDYNLLTTWRDLLTARIAFFEPMGTHISLVREIKSELRITIEALAAADARGEGAGDYSTINLTSAERHAMAGALMHQAATVQGRVERSQLLGRADEERGFQLQLATIQSAYAKVRA